MYQAAIAAALPGVRMTQHSFDDVVLTKIALAARFPIEKAVVELNRLRSTLSIDTRTAAEYLKVRCLMGMADLHSCTVFFSGLLNTVAVPSAAVVCSY